MKENLTQRVGGKLLKLGTKDVHWTSKRLDKDARLLSLRNSQEHSSQSGREKMGSYFSTLSTSFVARVL